MGMEFEYDATGNTSYIFLLSGLVLYLSLATCRKIGGKSDIKQSEVDETIKKHTPTTLCAEKQQQLHERAKKKRGNMIPIGNLVYYAAWVAFIALVFKVSTFEAESVYSPFDILGLDEDADAKAIKAKYRELSRQYHPDKNPDDEEAAEKFIQIHKAYEALTDEVTRANWEKYGNPDGRQVAEFGIALPAWIVDQDNAHLVLGLYVFIFMLCLPTYIGCWWYNRTNYYSDDVMLMTMRIYGYYINPAAGAIMTLLNKMCLCEEYELIKLREPLDPNTLTRVIKQIEDVPDFKKWTCKGEKPPGPKELACLKSRGLLLIHIEGLRSELPPELIEDLNFCLKRAPMLIDAMIEMLTYKQQNPRRPRMLRTFIAAMHLSQLLVQAERRENQDPFMQIPHMNTRILKSIKSKKNKILTMEDFFSISEESRRALLSKNITDEVKLRDIEIFGSVFPFLSVDVKVKVGDEEEVTAGSLITVSVTLTRRKMADLKPTLDEERLKRVLAGKEGSEQEEEDEKAKIIRQYAAKNAKKGKKKPVKKKLTSKKGKIEVEEGGGDGDASAKASDGENDVDNTDKVEAPGADAAEETANPEPELDEDDEDSDEEAVAVVSAKKSADEDGDESSDEEFDWGDDETFEEQSEKQQKAKLRKMKGKESYPVHCPWFPEPKQEWWWVFLGEEKANNLVTELQRVQSLTDEEEIDLMLMAPPRAQTLALTLYVVSDSYYGIDIRVPIKINVKPALAQPDPAEEIESEEDDPFMIEESEESDEDDFA